MEDFRADGVPIFANESANAADSGEAEGYRMASRKFYCYQCEKKFSQMVNLNAPKPVCETCGGNFVEYMDKKAAEKDNETATLAR